LLEKKGWDFAPFTDPPIIIPAQTEEELWDQIEPLIPGLESIYFAGGEPLIMEEHYQILKLLDEKKLYHVKLTYSTNFSQMKYKDQDVIELWNKFDTVWVGASLDGSYARGEYIRKGQKWEQAVKNRKRMLAACPNVHFFLAPTVSILNVWHLPDFHQEWFDLGLIGPNEWTTNVLNYPAHLSIQALPSWYKQRVAMKYRQYLDIWITQDKEFARTINAFESIIKYIWEDNLIDEIPKFKEYMRTLDEIREENLLEVFPELEEVVKY
jgi:sulfatase maturation enzyme AslB (radical SAM superfamily)